MLEDILAAAGASIIVSQSGITHHVQVFFDIAGIILEFSCIYCQLPYP